MLTVELGPEPPPLEEVARRLGVRPDQLDRAFGTPLIDPSRHRYAVLVDADAADAAAASAGVEGPYSNPRIEPFGPPQG
jgi:hypothetical protein